jgi:thiopurine S-methyltransferase
MTQWNTEQIGWHNTYVHKSIQKYGNQFIAGLMTHDDDVAWDATQNTTTTTTVVTEENTCSAPSPVRVLVPLCGKSLDMAFLASQNAVAEVVGVDGVQQALDEFAHDNPQFNIRKVDRTVTTDSTVEDADAGVTTTRKEAAKTETMSKNNYEQWEGDKITLLQGDFFHLNEQATGGKFDAIFDRGSLVAIHPDLREAYVTILGSLLKPGGRILIVTVYRCSGTDDDKSGPPYSVSEDDMSTLYGGLEWVESITLLEKDSEKDSKRPAMFYLIQAR